MSAELALAAASATQRPVRGSGASRNATLNLCDVARFGVRLAVMTEVPIGDTGAGNVEFRSFNGHVRPRGSHSRLHWRAGLRPNGAVKDGWLVMKIHSTSLTKTC